MSVFAQFNVIVPYQYPFQKAAAIRGYNLEEKACSLTGFRGLSQRKGVFVFRGLGLTQ